MSGREELWSREDFEWRIKFAGQLWDGKGLSCKNRRTLPLREEAGENKMGM